MLIFVVKNRQLKNLRFDASSFSLEYNMSCLFIINEIFTNLQSMLWSCRNLSLLPNFRRNFDDMKVLNFDLKCSGTYKNELLKIICYFPQLEELNVLNCSQNLMTIDDLIDLLIEASSTLKKLLIESIGPNNDWNNEFSRSLHTTICDATSIRSDIIIELVFHKYVRKQTFAISKKCFFGITNGKIDFIRTISQ